MSSGKNKDKVTRSLQGKTAVMDKNRSVQAVSRKDFSVKPLYYRVMSYTKLRHKMLYAYPVFMFNYQPQLSPTLLKTRTSYIRNSWNSFLLLPIRQRLQMPSTIASVICAAKKQSGHHQIGRTEIKVAPPLSTSPFSHLLCRAPIAVSQTWLLKNINKLRGKSSNATRRLASEHAPS